MATLKEQLLSGIAILIIGAGGNQLWNSYTHSHKAEFEAATQPLQLQMDTITDALKLSLPGFDEAYRSRVETQTQSDAFK